MANATARRPRKAAARQPAIEVARLGRALAGEVRNIDLRRPLDGTAAARVRHALLEHEVLVLRDQDITPRQLLDFGRAFGELSIHPFSPNLADMPELIVLDNHKDNPPALTDIWHSDETFRETPPMATILRASIVPRLGGDTMFASMSAAYEGLSDATQRFIDGLEGIFDFKPFRTLFGSDPESRKRLHALEDLYPVRTHPVVRVHPESGRRSVFVNAQFTIGIEGMKEAESRPLLQMLFDLAKRPEYQYRLQWQPGTIAFWDNRVTNHYAIHDYFPQRRRMERVTLKGDRPFGVDHPYAGPRIGRAEIAADPVPEDAAPVRQFRRH